MIIIHIIFSSFPYELIFETFAVSFYLVWVLCPCLSDLHPTLFIYFFALLV